MHLSASIAELEKLFAIEFASHEPFVVPSARDRRQWTVEDSEWLELLYQSGAGVALISLLLGHSRETIKQWASAAQLAPRPKQLVMPFMK